MGDLKVEKMSPASGALGIQGQVPMATQRVPLGQPANGNSIAPATPAQEEAIRKEALRHQALLSMGKTPTTIQTGQQDPLLPPVPVSQANIIESTHPTPSKTPLEEARSTFLVEDSAADASDPEKKSHGFKPFKGVWNDVWGGIRGDPSFAYAHSDEWWEKNGWMSFPIFGDAAKGHLNLGGSIITQWTYSPNPWDLRHDKSFQVPLTAIGSDAPFINPVTGEEVYLSRLYAAPGQQLQFQFSLEGTLRTESSWGDSLIYGQLYLMTQDKNGGLDYYQTESSGTVFDQGTGNFDSAVTFSTPTKKTRFGYQFYLRHLFPEFQLRIPLLAKGWEDATHANLEHSHEDQTFSDFIDKVLFNPTLGFAVLGEFSTDPKQGAPNRTPLLEPWSNQWGFLIASKDTGLFYERRWLNDSYRRYWNNGTQDTFGVKIPLKTGAHMLGWDWLENSLADDFELDEAGFPIAKLDTLMFDASSLIIAWQWENTNGSDYPLIGEFDPFLVEPGSMLPQRGSIGPGGPGGQYVSGKRNTLLIAMEANFGENTGDQWYNKWMKNTEWRLSFQYSDLDINSPNLDINTRALATKGGAGGVFTQIDNAIIPSTAGTEYAFTFEGAKRFPLENGLTAVLGGFGDGRNILNDLTNNSVYNGWIWTAGVFGKIQLANTTMVSAVKR